MRIYTEVNYIWKDDKLVQTDSKSYDYEGEIESCHWYHRHSPVVVPKITIPTKITIPSVPDIINAYKGSDIDKGLTSGQTAVTNTWEKIKEDNPDPNLNLQTPDKLWNKGRQALHDAATNIKRIWDRNRPSYGGADKAEDWEKGGATFNPLLEEDTGPGTRATAGGGKYGASGRATSGRRGIEKKQNLASTLITKHKQKRL